MSSACDKLVDSSNAENPDVSKDYFNNLPGELQLKIFSHFTPVELSKTIAPVCKKWWNVSKDASLWKDISFTISSEKNITTYCEVLLRCHLLNSLKIKSAVPLDCIVFCFIQLRPYFLKELDIAFCKGLNVDSISILVSNCPLIEFLNLEGCGLSIDFKCIYQIVTLKHLRSLNLSRCHSIDDLCIKTIATECKELELLNIENISRITDYAICELARHRQETLTHLFLEGEELTDESTLALSACEKLCTLCISCGEFLTDETLLALSSLPHLTWLKLREIPNLSARAFEDFFMNSKLTQLEVLELEMLTIDDKALYNLGRTCRNLHILSLPCCYEVTDAGLIAVVESCSRLFWLDLTFLSEITGKFLINVSDKLPNLRYLNLFECNCIPEDAVQNLAREMPNLKINFTFSEHDTHADSDEEVEVAHLMNRSLNVSWTKMPEGFCGRMGKDAHI